MFDFDYITKEDIKEHNPNWAEIPDHPYRILIIRDSGSGKTNALLYLINHEPNIDRIFLFAKYPRKGKYQLLINKRESTGCTLICLLRGEGAGVILPPSPTPGCWFFLNNFKTVKAVTLAFCIIQ